jgi:hypothetical protein
LVDLSTKIFICLPQMTNLVNKLFYDRICGQLLSALSLN